MTAMLHLNRSNPTLFPSLATRGIKDVQVLSLRRSYRELCSIPNIKSLNLSGCYSLSDANLDLTFQKEVLSLTSLNLSLCKELSDNSLTRIGKLTKITLHSLVFRRPSKPSASSGWNILGRGRGVMGILAFLGVQAKWTLGEGMKIVFP